MSDDTEKGFVCAQCGTYHKFTPYVFAHWNIDLVHNCDCGATHEILEGTARLLLTGKENG